MLTLQRGAGPKLLFSFLLFPALFATEAAANPPGDSSQPAATGWKIDFNSSGSSPVIANGVLYIGAEDGAVYALDPTTGATKWRFQTGEDLAPQIGPLIVTVPSGTNVDAPAALAGASADSGKLEVTGTRRVDMAPAIENGTVFVGSGDKSFYAIDAATGKKKWSYAAGLGMASRNGSFPFPPAIVKNGVVYFTSEQGLHAVDTLTGKRKWLFETLEDVPNGGGKRFPSAPVLSLDDGVFFLTAWPNATEFMKSFLYAVNLETGKPKWVTTVDGGMFIGGPVTAKGMVFFPVVEKGSDTTYRNGKRIEGKATLYAVDAASGQTKWKADAPMEYATSLATLIAGDVVLLGTDKGLFAYELATGHPSWTFGKDAPSIMLADEQTIYVDTHKIGFGGWKDTLHVLDRSTGKEKWSRGLGGEEDPGILVNAGVVYAGRGHLQAMDAATGKVLWDFKGTGHDSARLISGGRIFVASPTVTFIGSDQVNQGYLYAIDAKTGKLKP